MMEVVNNQESQVNREKEESTRIFPTARRGRTKLHELANLSVRAVNVSGLYSPVERHRLADLI